MLLALNAIAGPSSNRCFFSSAPGLLASSSSSSPIGSPFPYASPVPHRSVVRISGRDAQTFLNGVTATKIPDRFTALPFYSSILHAQGRILFDIHIYPHEPSSSFLIDYDVRSPTPLVAHLKKFVLRSKVGLRDVSGEWDVWGAWGREPKGGEKIWKWGQGGSAGLTWMTEPERLANAEGEVGGWDLRADGMGWRGLVPKGEKPALASADFALPTSNLSPTGSSSYNLHRILTGVPEGIDDLVPMSSLPSESNLDFMGGVDFRKGCYIGQELTVRTYHTGMTRKRIFPVQLYPLSTPPPDNLQPHTAFPLPSPGTEVRLTALDKPTARGRSSGRILSTQDGVGLALLRIEQVESVWRGDGKMTVSFGVEEEGKEGISGWEIRPFASRWWPVKAAEPSTVAAPPPPLPVGEGATTS